MSAREWILLIIAILGFVSPITIFLIKNFFLIQTTNSTLKTVQKTLVIVQNDLEERKISDARTEEKFKTVFSKIEVLEKKVFK